MKNLVPILAGAAVALAGCGQPEALALSDDPTIRAAQCGVIATAAARTAQTDVKADLPFAVQTEVLHYALLAATADGGYDQARAGAVLKALPEQEPAVIKAKWQDVAPACDAAFPEAKAAATLPATALDAQLGCSMLAQYVGGALQSQEARYSAELQPIRQMRMGLDDSIGARLARAGQRDREDQKGARDKAMVAIVHAGAAPAVLDACVERFPGDA